MECETLTKIRVVIVDDHPAARNGICTYLAERLKGYSIVGEAASSNEAIRIIEELKPELVILDLFLEGGPCFDLIRHLTYHQPSIHILICSTNEDFFCIEQALRAGAIGYVDKGASIDTIVASIQAVTRGELVAPTDIALRLCISEMTTETEGDIFTPLSRLTPLEQRVFKLTGAGYRITDIVHSLKINRLEIMEIRARIKKKLEYECSEKLQIRAFQHDFVKTPT